MSAANKFKVIINTLKERLFAESAQNRCQNHMVVLISFCAAHSERLLSLLWTQPEPSCTNAAQNHWPPALFSEGVINAAHTTLSVQSGCGFLMATHM